MRAVTFWGALIRQLRTERGLSERATSVKAGLSRTTLRKIEAGGVRTTVPQVEALLAVFGYELDAFPRRKEE